MHAHKPVIFPIPESTTVGAAQVALIMQAAVQLVWLHVLRRWSRKASGSTPQIMYAHKPVHDFLCRVVVLFCLAYFMQD
jgi:hypothetical protein